MFPSRLNDNTNRQPVGEVLHSHGIARALLGRYANASSRRARPRPAPVRASDQPAQQIHPTQQYKEMGYYGRLDKNVEKLWNKIKSTQ